MLSKFLIALIVFLFFYNLALVAEDVCTFSDLESNVHAIERYFGLNVDVDDIDSRKQDCFDVLLKVIENEEWNHITALQAHLTGIKNNREDSLFVHFIRLGNTKVVETIIQKDLVELLLCGDTIEGTCPLHRAIRTDFPDLINLLLNNGIGWINQKDKSGKTPLHTAIDAKFADIVEFLIQKGSSLTDSVPILINDIEVDFFPLHYCVMRGDIYSLDVIIEYLLDDRKDSFISKSIKKIGNILHVAINFNRYDLLEHLLTEYIDETKILLDKENNDDETPLILAAILGDERSIKLLHDKGADLEQETSGGKRAIHFAAENRQKGVIRLLKHLGVDINAEDSRGKRAIDLVADLQDFSSITTSNVLLNVSKEKESCKRPRNLILGEFMSGVRSSLVDPYLGAVQLLEEKDMMNDVWRIATSSARARFAVLLAVGYSADEINDIIEKNIDELIFDKLGVKNCTFGELRRQRDQGENVKHLYLIANDESGQKSVFNSEDGEWDDLVISSVITKQKFILHYKDNQNTIYPRDDKGFFELCDDVSIGFFDKIKFIKKGFSKSEENHPISNSKTLALFANSNHIDDRILNIDVDETSSDNYFQLGYDAAKQFFKNQYYDSFLFSCYSFDYDKSGFISIKNKHPNFVGRDEYIESLEDKLINNNSWKESKYPVALCGFGGMGKSELAIYFANINSNHFHTIFWIDASSEDSLNQAYRLLAERLKIDLSDKPDDLLVRDRVFSKLENNKSEKPWLLVYDNVKPWLLLYENGEQKLKYPQRGGCILVTSRKQEYGGKRLWNDIIQIDPLSQNESIDLLRKVTGQNDRDNMATLAKQFGGFPLALSNAASYIANTQISIAEFVEDLPDEIYWDLDEEERYDQNQTLEYIYEMTIKDLETNCPQAIEWLNICSYFHYESIPREWIDNWLEHEKNLPPKDAKYTARRIFRLLNSYNLIRNDETANTFFSLHNLTQEYIRNNQQNEKKSFLSAFHIINRWRKKFEPHNPHTWENGHGRLWMIHAQNTLNVDMVNEEIENDLDDIYFYLGMMLGMSADYKKSVFYYEKALAIAQNVDPDNHLKRAGWLFELASMTELIEHSTEKDIKSIFRESLSIYENMLDSNDFTDSEGLLYNNRAGMVTFKLRDFKKALKYFERSLEYLEETCNDEDCDLKIARELNNVGNSLYFLRDYESSLGYLEKSLEIFKSYSDDPTYFDVTIFLYNGLGGVFKRLGRIDEALQSFKKALEMIEMIFKEIPEKRCEMIAPACESVMDCLSELNRCEEAIPYLKKAAHYCNNDEVNMEYFEEVCW